jgi:hypothetical protein
MYVPTIQGLIERRILANYRIRPEALAGVVPPPFRPKLVRGWGIGGICLIRLKKIRPRWLPPFIGLGSENAAHRIAVEWDEDGQTREGVYIPRRDTSSRLNAVAGGRLFPGLHHRAAFTVVEAGNRFFVAVISDDGQTRVRIDAQIANALPSSSIFTSLEESSQFFATGVIGYSTTASPSRFDGLELHCQDWRVEPLNVGEIESSFFENQDRFPAGSVEFDCALLMRGIEHEWHTRNALCCGQSC